MSKLDPTMSVIGGEDNNPYVQVGIPNAQGTALASVQQVRAGSPLVVTLTNSNSVVGQLQSDEPALTAQTVTKPIQPGDLLQRRQRCGHRMGARVPAARRWRYDRDCHGSSWRPHDDYDRCTPGRRLWERVHHPAGHRRRWIQVDDVDGGVAERREPWRGDRDRHEQQSGNCARFSRWPDCGYNVREHHGSKRTDVRAVFRARSRQRRRDGHVDDLRAGFRERQSSGRCGGFGRGDSTARYADIDPGPRGHRFVRSVGIPNAGNTALAQIQFVRPGAPLVITLTNSDDAVGVLRSDEPVATGQTVTKPIQPGIYFSTAVQAGTSWGLGFEALANGFTNVTATGPAGVLTMSQTGVRRVDVQDAEITPPGTTVVGARLMTSTGVALGAAGHGGIDVTVTSSNPARVRVSADPVTVGTGLDDSDRPERSTVRDLLLAWRGEHHRLGDNHGDYPGLRTGSA